MGAKFVVWAAAIVHAIAIRAVRHATTAATLATVIRAATKMTRVGFMGTSDSFVSQIGFKRAVYHRDLVNSFKKCYSVTD